MFKAVYFHKTVRAAEVMLAEAMRLAESELNLTSLNYEEYLKLTDNTIIEKLLSLPSANDQLKKAKKFAFDYQNRNLLKCVFEKNLDDSDHRITNDIRAELAKKAKVDESYIFVDRSKTPSLPLLPSKQEPQYIILISKEKNRPSAFKVPISEMPLVSVLSGFMDILRVYTTKNNRHKVSAAAQSILGRM